MPVMVKQWLRLKDDGSGFTLTEVLVAALVGAVVTWGTASAFLAAARMMQTQNNSALAEAASYAQQTLERKRNMIACDAPWFNPATCAPTLPIGWQDDAFRDADGNPYAGGTESILNRGAQRRYCVTPANCDGVPDPPGEGDCFRVEVRVCWAGGTPCPAVGSACP